MNIEEIRQKYPQYDSLSDEELGGKLYDKYYSTKMDRDEFNSRIGLKKTAPAPVPAPATPTGIPRSEVGGLPTWTQNLPGTEFETEQRRPGPGVLRTAGTLAGQVIGGAGTTLGSGLQGVEQYLPTPGAPNQFAMSDAEAALEREDWKKRTGGVGPLERAGQALSRASQEAFPKDPQVNELAQDVASGVGSLGANIATSLVNPAAGMALALGQGTGEARERARGAGATPEQVEKAGYLGGGSGATEFIDSLLPFLGTPARATSFLARVGYRAVAGALLEGGQEGLQQLIQNAIARGIYKPDQNLMEDVEYSALVGGLVGGVAGPVLGGHKAPGSGLDRSVVTPPTQEDLDKLLDPNTVPPGTPPVVTPPTTPPSVPPTAPPSDGKILEGGVPPITPPPRPVDPVSAADRKETALTAKDYYGEGAITPVEGATPPPDRLMKDVVLPTPTEEAREPRLEPLLQDQLEALKKGYYTEDVGGKIMPGYGGVPGGKMQSPAATGTNPASIVDQSQSSSSIGGTTLSMDPVDPIATEAKGKAKATSLAEATKLMKAVGIDTKLNPTIVTQRDGKMAPSVHSTTVAEILALLDKTHLPSMTGENFYQAQIRKNLVAELARVIGTAPVHFFRMAQLSKLGVAPVRGVNFSPNMHKTPLQRGGDYVYMNMDALSDPKQFVHTLLHEMVHTATVRIMGRVPQLNLQMRKILEEAWPHFHAEAHKAGWTPGTVDLEDHFYGFTNTLEFVTEALNNAWFQERLAHIKLSPKLARELHIAQPKSAPRMNLWQALVETVRRWMGYAAPKSNNEMRTEFSVLEAILRVGSRTIDLQAQLPGDPARYIPSEVAKNAKLVGEGAVEPQPELEAAKANAMAIFGGRANTPPIILQAGAYADRMNKFYKWAAGLDQLIRANRNFEPIVRYGEVVGAMDVLEKQLQDGGLTIAKAWGNLGRQGENLTAFLDDLTNMNYRTPKEVKDGIYRHPTALELRQLVTTHNLSAESIRVAGMIKTYFDDQLNRVGNTAKEQAKATLSGSALADRLTKIDAELQTLRDRPYFPFMRFGLHYVLVKDKKGKTVSFETFERVGLKSAKKVQAEALARAKQNLGPGEVATSGVMSEKTEPFVGLPPTLLNSMLESNKFNFTQQQRDEIAQLALSLSPQQSFRHRFQQKNYVEGYSMDFKRAFARSAFFGSRYIARSKYVPQLDLLASIAEKWNQNPTGNNVTEQELGQYMRDHLNNNVLDTRGDLGAIRGAAFFWTMAFVPAAATQNMSQTPLITLPYLAAKFGDARAIKALSKAMSDLQTFYRQGSYQGNDFFNQAMSYGIASGTIKESMAAELAGLGNGNGLLSGFGGNAIQRGILGLAQKASWMFEMAEQMNRRIAYRATLDLAMAQPNAKIVQEAIKRHELEYTALQAGTSSTRPMTAKEAAAVITAVYATQETQYSYSKSNRPRVFQGPLRATIFMFQKFLQSTLFLLHQNPDMITRFILMSMLIGGIGGLPFYEDIRSIVKGVAHSLFGKHYDIEKEMKEYLTLAVGDYADLMLHGFSRYGFGIPAILDLFGSTATGVPGRGFDVGSAKNVPFPVVDRSRAITISQVLPFDVGKLIEPAKDVNSTIAEQVQKSSGPVWSVGFNMYKAVMDHEHALTDPKRWERAVPRVMGNASRGWRYLTEGRERLKTGGEEGAATFLEYNWKDPEQAMEILATTLGYNTLRSSSKWDNVIAKADLSKFYEMRQKGLLGQYHEAWASDDPKGLEKATETIQKYNETLPEVARGYKISRDMLDRSLKAREGAAVKRELDVPLQRRQAPIYEDVNRLYKTWPNVRTIEDRRVR